MRTLPAPDFPLLTPRPPEPPMRATLLVPLILVCAATPIAGQTIRDQYLAHLPPMPKLVSATLATERFHLFWRHLACVIQGYQSRWHR